VGGIGELILRRKEIFNEGRRLGLQATGRFDISDCKSALIPRLPANPAQQK
jgi:hypothetical protein